jgi:SAM-dependent methyltransferase
MKDFWNERYADAAYAYGMSPNLFFAQQLDKLNPGRIILPCEGEGRNAVYAAAKGWDAEAFDISEEGRSKALELSGRKGVRITYHLEDVQQATYPEETFDAAALIYTHLPISIRQAFHHKVISWLRPGGTLILEAFNPAQIHNTSGGPKDVFSLYSEELLRGDFAGMKILQLDSVKIDLDEGKYHQGPADVVRMIAIREK